jgi:hypothetical protein
MVGPVRSSLQGWRRRWSDLPGGRDPWSRLWRHFELELHHQELLIGVQLGVAAKDQHASISRGEVNVKYLDGGKFVELCPCGKAAGQRPKPPHLRRQRSADQLRHETAARAFLTDVVGIVKTAVEKSG